MQSKVAEDCKRKRRPLAAHGVSARRDAAVRRGRGSAGARNSRIAASAGDHRGGRARVRRARLSRRQHAGHRRRARHPAGEPLLLFSAPRRSRSNWSACRASTASSRPRSAIAAGPGTPREKLAGLDPGAHRAAARPRRFREGVPHRAPVPAERKPAPDRQMVARDRADLRGRDPPGRAQGRIPRRYRSAPDRACDPRHGELRSPPGTARRMPRSSASAANLSRWCCKASSRAPKSGRRT